MDRGLSRSVPYLPRYHSASPARSPSLSRRVYSSLRSLSQPSQRIFYHEGEPTRVINSYHAHSSPSPKRAYKVTVCSSKLNHHVSRVTKSHSTHDLNSSHVYTSSESLCGSSVKEAASRKVGSCEDLYHKGPFFPDITPSESGVSVGESEEGSIFGTQEDDNISQHSFGSSSAFYELTLDSEMERCDSDAFSQADSAYVGDRTLDILYEDDLDEAKGKGERKYRRASRGSQSPDSSRASPLSYTDSRKRELMSSPSRDFEKTQSRFQALRVLIPGNDKNGKDHGKVGDRRSLSTTPTPLAQSTPHVSPRDFGEAKLSIKCSWNVDDPFDEVLGQGNKSKAARALFEMDISDTDTKETSRLEDSSFNSSYSEDNFSDISNATISSPVLRKTKLVKKASDKPTSSVKINSQSTPLSLSALRHRDNAEHADNAKNSEQFIDTTSGLVDPANSSSIKTSSLLNTDNGHARQTLSKLIPRGQSLGEQETGIVGNEWWAVYNIGSAQEREAQGVSREPENRENISNYSREIRIVKPVKVNIPLINPGKQGQEKLKRHSQTSPPLTQSPTERPPLSARDATQTPGDEEGEKRKSDQGKTNIGHFEGRGERESDELMKFDGHIKGEQFNTGLELGETKYLPGDLPCNSSFISSETENKKDDKRGINSSDRTGCSTDVEFMNRSSDPGENAKNLALEFVSNEWSSHHSDDQYCKTQHGGVAGSDGNDRTEENSCHYGLGNALGETEEAQRASDSATLPVESAQVADERSRGLNTSVPDKNNHLEARTPMLQDGFTRNREHAGSNENTPVFLSGETSTGKDADCLLDKSKTNEEKIPGKVKGQFNQGITSDGVTVYNNLESGVSVEQELTGKDTDNNINSCDFSLKDSNQNNAISDEKQRHQQPDLNQSSDDKASADVTSVEDTTMENLIDPHIKCWRGMRNTNECGETPQMVVRVVATAQKIDDKDEDIIYRDGSKSAFYSPQRGVGITHQLATSVPSSLHPHESFDSRIDVNLDSSSTGNNSFQCDTSYGQHSDNFDTSDGRVKFDSRSNNSHGQQGGAGYDLSQGISTPVDDESIKQPSAASRGNKGICQEEEKSNAVKDGSLFVERAEEFIRSPSPVRKQVNITEFSSKHVKRVTVEKIVTTERTVNHSPSGCICSSVVTGDSVDIVTNKSTTETIVKEDDDIFTTTTSTLYSDHSRPVSIEKNSFESDTGSPTCLPSSLVSTITSSPRPGRDGSLHSATNLPTPSVSTTRLTYQDSPPPLQVMREKSDSWAQNNSTPDLSYTSVSEFASVTKDTEKARAGEELNPARDDRLKSTMHRDSRLDTLQAQLSLISGDLSPLGTNTIHTENTSAYHDHAEATSVLKQIVRGETGDFTNFSVNSGVSVTRYDSCNVNTGSVQSDTGESTDSVSVTGAKTNGGGKVEREEYDNDYEYVTTDLPKQQHSSRTHHLQLLKPGHLKASSLWTLQEETESVIGTLTPNPSPKRSLVTLASEEEKGSNQSSLSNSSHLKTKGDKDQGDSGENDHTKFTKTSSSAFRQRSLISESSDFDESDGNYSSISTTESTSHRSSSYGREQTPLSETESVPLGPNTDKMDYQEVDEWSQSSSIDRISSFHEFVSGLEPDNFTRDTTNISTVSAKSRGGNSSDVSMSHHESVDSSSIKTFKSSLAFCVTSPDGNDISDSESTLHSDSQTTLHNLSLALEQFNTSGQYELESSTLVSGSDRISLPFTKEALSAFTDSHSREDMLNISTTSSTLHSWNDDATSEASSRLRALDLDLSRISSCSPTPSDFSEGSMYTCTGTAEIKKPTVSFDYSIPSPSVSTPKNKSAINLKPALKKPHSNKAHDERIKQFEKILDEFDESICPTKDISELMILEKRAESTETHPSNYDDLYKAFTNDDSEKKQNHSCIVVEDENMNTFRFKRFLKKSHTKRKKGKKVMKFLSKLGCVSESVGSPNFNANRRPVLSETESQTFSTDSMHSPTHRISNPVLISSTSFHHHDLNTSPERSYKGGNTPSSSNQSLDSLRSRADSAYSSISDSTAGSLSSPVHVSQGSSSSSLRVPPLSSGSISSVFHSGSTSNDRSFSDSAYSTSSDATMRTFSEADFTLQHSPNSKVDGDMMSALSDVFEQLDVCEGEIDTALLNRMRHGHTHVDTPRK